jgi:streptogramin lyase
LTVVVSQVLTSLSLTPATATVPDGTTQQFTATALDQFGLDLTQLPTLGWSVDAGGLGTVSSNGLYTAPASGTASVTVQAGSDSLSATAAVSVVPNIPITEFPIPTASSVPIGITAGPDGNVWFTESQASKIGRITPAGSVTEFSLPPPLPQNDASTRGPGDITLGPDGNLWFTEGFGPYDSIGMITPAGQVSEFVIPTLNSDPQSITTGPDGNLWFTERGGNKIGEINPATGAITEYAVPTPNSQPFGITAGLDGNLWFTEYSGGKIGRITPAGVITEFVVGPQLLGITSGGDGNLWFADFSGGSIGRLDPFTGTVTEFALPSGNGAGPQYLTAGPDGNVWFGEIPTNVVGCITPAGVITQYSVPSANAWIQGITAGPDGNVWFTENIAEHIGRISLGFAPTVVIADNAVAAIQMALSPTVSQVTTALDSVSPTTAPAPNAPTSPLAAVQPTVTATVPLSVPPALPQSVTLSGGSPTGSILTAELDTSAVTTQGTDAASSQVEVAETGAVTQYLQPAVPAAQSTSAPTTGGNPKQYFVATAPLGVSYVYAAFQESITYLIDPASGTYYEFISVGAGPGLGLGIKGLKLNASGSLEVGWATYDNPVTGPANFGLSVNGFAALGLGISGQVFGNEITGQGGTGSSTGTSIGVGVGVSGIISWSWFIGTGNISALPADVQSAFYANVQPDALNGVAQTDGVLDAGQIQSLYENALNNSNASGETGPIVFMPDSPAAVTDAAGTGTTQYQLPYYQPVLSEDTPASVDGPVASLPPGWTPPPGVVTPTPPPQPALAPFQTPPPAPTLPPDQTPPPQPAEPYTPPAPVPVNPVTQLPATATAQLPGLVPVNPVTKLPTTATTEPPGYVPVNPVTQLPANADPGKTVYTALGTQVVPSNTTTTVNPGKTVYTAFGTQTVL